MPDATSQPDDRRRRLEALNRRPLEKEPNPPADADADTEELRQRIRKGLRSRRGRPQDAPPAPRRIEPIVFQRDLPRREVPPPVSLPPIGPPVALEEAVDGAEAVAPDGSCAYLVERPLAEPDGPWAALCDALAGVLARRDGGLWRQLEWIGVDGPVSVEDLLFLDLETTGLSSSPLFLVGAMVWQGGGLVVRQYFARDYSEERAALKLFLELAARRRLLVSFNGKSFDLPYVRMRAAANGIPCRLDCDHLDLLHAARRIWRPRVPDCRLQTLERIICGRHRTDDIPGALIPDAYHEYVRSGNAARMVNVLEHNFLDLVTLADIMVRMSAGGS
jgi:uncharacterized protein YprB with RNaseH-like and TPR domain